MSIIEFKDQDKIIQWMGETVADRETYDSIKHWVMEKLRESFARQQNGDPIVSYNITPGEITLSDEGVKKGYAFEVRVELDTGEVLSNVAYLILNEQGKIDRFCFMEEVIYIKKDIFQS